MSKTQAEARREAIKISGVHFVSGNPTVGPFADHLQTAIFGMGCFWGAEKRFWELDGVFSTAVGYAGGELEHPTYQDVCGGSTGHAEVVLVVYDPDIICYERLLKAFWEGHNPTQGMRQGNDVGSQYRSAVYATSDRQLATATASLESYEELLLLAGHHPISTEIRSAPPFYYAEEYHQQYLAKNPNGYCGLGGTGVSCPLVAPNEADAKVVHGAK